MHSSVGFDRRRFLAAAALSIAAAPLGPWRIGAAQAQSTSPPSFGPLKQIDAGVLNVGYAEAGPADGRPVLLLHGWPYDIHSFADVAPLLAAAGYRVIVPYLRGYGTTRFLSADDAAQRPAGGRCRRHRRADGCAQDREGDRSPASTGARAPPTSSRRCGRSAARPWSRSAAT